MSYMHIKNLPAAQEIMLFKEAWASEKIHGCLKKGTLVLLATGKEQPIESLRRGDVVVSYDEKAKKFIRTRVEGVLIQEADPRLGWMEVSLASGRQVICTIDHPFLTNRGWIPAGQLKKSDNIVA